MRTRAVVMQAPERLALAHLELQAPGDDDVVVDIQWSGISTGTERLLWNGQMPTFPGMGYPLVPGYESVGRVVQAGANVALPVGEAVFVPGARCYGEVRGLFGGAASRLVVAAERVVPLGGVDHDAAPDAVLLALAATAYHAVAEGGRRDPIVPPELIIGHGVLGRLLARMTVAAGCPAPVVWEPRADRRGGADGYAVISAEDDPRRDYGAIYDASGDSRVLDAAIGRLKRGGEIVLAGFYSQPLSFLFAPAFMREARIRCAAEWQRADMLAVRELIASGRISLAGLLTHQLPATDAETAYRTAFGDAQCLKMVLDWRTLS